MREYIATFYTHLAALRSFQAIKREGREAEMTPVPRALSSACGTCVRYRAEEPLRELINEDFEQIVEILPCGGYAQIFFNR